MITVSSCGVKLQEVLSGLDKERLKHWRYTCTFVAFLNITFFFFSFHLGCNFFFFFFFFFLGGGGGGGGWVLQTQQKIESGHFH